MRDLEAIQYPGSCTLKPGPIRVVTWNVRFWSSARQILKRIKSFNADILLLQELSSGSDLPWRIQDLGYGGVLAECENFPWMRFGNAVFSRLSVGEPRYTDLRIGGHPPWKFNGSSRCCYLETDLSFPGDELTVGNVHLSYPLPLMTELRGVEQEQFLQKVGGYSKRTIFGGDLNVTPDSTLVESLNRDFRNLGPHLSVPTWPRGWLKPLVRSRRLDYLFGTPDIEVLRVKIGAGAPSDHFPLMFEIALQAID